MLITNRAGDWGAFFAVIKFRSPKCAPRKTSAQECDKKGDNEIKLNGVKFLIR